MSKTRTIKAKKWTLLMIVMLAVVALIGGTYARYTSNGNATSNAQIAKWHIELNDQDMTSTSTEVDLVAAKVEGISNNNVSDGKLAPGQTLAASLNVNPSGSEVAIDYLLTVGEIQSNNIDVTDISVTGVQAVKDGVVTNLPLSNENYQFFESLSDVEANKDITFRVLVSWADNNNVTDTANGANPETITVPVSITARQHLENDDTVTNVSSVASFETALEGLGVNDKLVLEDSVDFSGTYAKYAGHILRFNDYNTLDLNNNTITSLNQAVIYQGNGLTIKNGTISTDGTYALFLGGKDSLMDDNVQTSGYLLNNLTLNGGLNTDHASNVVLENVSITGHAYYTIFGNAETDITINNGVYNIGGSNKLLGMYKVRIANDAAAGNASGTFTINGGTFITGGDSSKFCLSGTNYVTPQVYGGTFDCEVPAECIPSGYECVPQGDGMYVVQETV